MTFVTFSLQMTAYDLRKETHTCPRNASEASTELCHHSEYTCDMLMNLSLLWWVLVEELLRDYTAHFDT